MSLRKLQSFSSLCDESAKQHSEWVSQACSVAKIQKVAKQAFFKPEIGVRVPDEYAALNEESHQQHLVGDVV